MSRLEKTTVETKGCSRTTVETIIKGHIRSNANNIIIILNGFIL